MDDKKVVHKDPMERPPAQSFCDYYRNYRDSIVDRINSGEIKLTSKMITVEEVKKMKNKPKK